MNPSSHDVANRSPPSRPLKSSGGFRDALLSRGRLNAEERFESEGTTRSELRTSLRAMTTVNLRLGGLRSLLSHLKPLVRGTERLSLLDVATGSGELPSELAGRMARNGTRVDWIGMDLHPAILQEARRLCSAAAPPALIRADARSIPLPDGSVDIVTASLFLHHLKPDEAVIALKEMARVSRLAVLVSDLERHPLHYLGARLLAATLWRHDPITRHDGPVSVLRSYTASELRELAQRAGFSTFHVRRHIPFRLVLEGHP